MTTEKRKAKATWDDFIKSQQGEQAKTKQTAKSAPKAQQGEQAKE